MTTCTSAVALDWPRPGNRVLAGAALDRWFVLHTRSRQEKAVAAALHAARVEHFLPLVRTTRLHGRRRAEVEIPLFPGYVFLFGLREQAYHLDRAGRIAQIIDVADQEQLSTELDQVRRALESDLPVDPWPCLQAGVRVAVRSGPLAGLHGLIESRTKNHRLVLQVNVLGQACSVEIDGELLDVLD